VLQTQFGVEKVIPFFSPDRQDFIEYDISYLIDTAITRQKTRVGILSPLPVMGEDVSGYMAQMMRMQGQQPAPAWTFVEQLRQQYEVKNVASDANDIKDVDILLVIHPKNLSKETLFAIDQFILKGGRTIICIDPYCVVDQQGRQEMQTGASGSAGSNLAPFLRTWGLKMPANTFAGDRGLALRTSLTINQRPEKIIGFLNLTGSECFNTDTVITAKLNAVRVLFAGVLREAAEPNEKEQSQIERTALITTTNRGNSWSVSSPFELMIPDSSMLMKKFIDGTEPVAMGYLVTGKFKSSFPEGIEIETGPEDPNEPEKTKKRITGLAEAQDDCAVVVFADVDFISDILAYRDFFFGKTALGETIALC